MDAANQLMTLAEISVALAGFAGIISAVQLRNDSDVTLGRVISLAIILYASLGGVFFFAFPLLLMNFGLSEAEVWKWSSLLIGLTQVYLAIFFWRKSPRSKWKPVNKCIFHSLFGISVLLGIGNLMNAAGIVFEREFGIFFALYMFNLGLVRLNFARLMMNPLWRILQKQENSGGDIEGMPAN